MTIAEEFDVLHLGDPAAVGGGDDRSHSLGFDYKWNLGWMHDTLEYFATDPLLRSGRHERLTWPIWYAFDEQYLLPLSHDEVVHLKKALLTKMPGDDWQRFANLRALYAYQYAHPGQEAAVHGRGVRPVGGVGRGAQPGLAPPGARRRQAAARPPCTAGVQSLRARPQPAATAPCPPCTSSIRSPRGFDWIEHGDAQSSVIAFLRRGEQPGDVVGVVCNFTPVVRQDYPSASRSRASGRRC